LVKIGHKSLASFAQSAHIKWSEILQIGHTQSVALVIELHRAVSEGIKLPGKMWCLMKPTDRNAAASCWWGDDDRVVLGVASQLAFRPLPVTVCCIGERSSTAIRADTIIVVKIFLTEQTELDFRVNLFGFHDN
jgi:hypothetical protein